MQYYVSRRKESLESSFVNFCLHDLGRSYYLKVVLADRVRSAGRVETALKKATFYKCTGHPLTL